MKYIDGLVSVIIPTYKRSEMLSRAVESVLNQSYKNIELLLVNDNDPKDRYTAELKERVEKYQSDPRFSLVLQEKHVNGAVARNIGINKARGEFIAFLDDDDWWKKDKIERQVSEFRKLSADYGVVSCRVEKFNGDTLIGRVPRYSDGYVYKDILMLRPNYTTGTLVFRHTYLDECGYFDESLERHQDLQLMVDFTYHYKIHVVDEFLYCADVSDDNNRPNVEKMRKAKINFFKSIRPIYESLTPKEKKVVKLMHTAEYGYIQLKHGDYLNGLKSFLQLLCSPTAFCYECIKFNDKIKTKKAALK